MQTQNRKYVCITANSEYCFDLSGLISAVGEFSNAEELNLENLILHIGLFIFCRDCEYRITLLFSYSYHLSKLEAIRLRFTM